MVGATVVGVAALAVLTAGCAGDSDGASAVPAVVSEAPTVEVTDVEPPFSTEDPYATEEPVYAAGPEGEIDQAVAEKGWETDVYDPPSALVTAVCADLASGPDELGQSPAQWLVEGMHMEGDDKHILLLGIPKLCPKWTSAVKAAAAGKYERWFGDGTYVVTSKKVDGEQTIPPGTYQAVGKMDDCYWERTAESGDIIDNSFATSARKITVTIRSSDGQFTSERCATWKPVK